MCLARVWRTFLLTGDNSFAEATVTRGDSDFKIPFPRWLSKQSVRTEWVTARVTAAISTMCAVDPWSGFLFRRPTAAQTKDWAALGRDVLVLVVVIVVVVVFVVSVAICLCACGLFAFCCQVVFSGWRLVAVALAVGDMKGSQASAKLSTHFGCTSWRPSMLMVCHEAMARFVSCGRGPPNSTLKGASKCCQSVYLILRRLVCAFVW